MLAQGAGIATPRLLSPPEVLKPVEEAAGVSTNEAAQTGLQIIEIMEFCKDQLPTDPPVRPVRAPFGGRGGARGEGPPAAAPAGTQKQ